MNVPRPSTAMPKNMALVQSMTHSSATCSDSSGGAGRHLKVPHTKKQQGSCPQYASEALRLIHARSLKRCKRRHLERLSTSLPCMTCEHPVLKLFYKPDPSLIPGREAEQTLGRPPLTSAYTKPPSCMPYRASTHGASTMAAA